MAEILLEQAYNLYRESNVKNIITVYYPDYIKGDLKSLWELYYYYLRNDSESNKEPIMNHLKELMSDKIPIFRAITKDSAKDIAKKYHQILVNSIIFDQHIYRCYIYTISQIKGFGIWEEYIEELLEDLYKLDTNSKTRRFYEAHVAGNLDGTYGLYDYYIPFGNICQQGIAIYLEDKLFNAYYQPILVKRFLNSQNHDDILHIGSIIINQPIHPGTGIAFYQMVEEKYNKHLLESYEVLSESE